MADLIGMVHLPVLRPTDPLYGGLEAALNHAVAETKRLEDAGFDALMLENFGDRPFQKSQVSTVVLSQISVIAAELKRVSSLSIGLNLLRNASVQAMEVASGLSLDFIRSNIWESAYITDQGLIEGVAHDVIAAKHTLRSSVDVYADIFVKHATPLADFSVFEAAEQALGRGGADRVIISGRGTGSEIDFSQLETLNSHDILPVIGSGARQETLSSYAGKVSGIIVGSAIKVGGVTSEIDPAKAANFVEAWKELV
ncbi:MAG: BtpA/SgcQ family protein [Candidatus Kariarchaeaceae archaeon]|jgi:membrane complex biogenesis BtpA family protein